MAEVVRSRGEARVFVCAETGVCRLPGCSEVYGTGALLTCPVHSVWLLLSYTPL